MAGCSGNGDRGALGRDREGRGRWSEGVVIQAAVILTKGGGTVGEEGLQG